MTNYEANFEFNKNSLEFQGELSQNQLHADLIVYFRPSKTSQLINDSEYITIADVPTKLSELVNDTDFITSSALIPLENDIVEIENDILGLQNSKVDKVTGKGLSTNDFTNALKTKLEGIEAGAEVNKVNSVNGMTGDVVIEIPDSATWGNITGTLSDQTDLQQALNAKQNTISDLDEIRAGASAGATAVQPSDLATVATTGDYDDLLNKPTIPTVNDATLTITQGGTTKGTFTANASSNTTIALDAGTTYTAGTGLKLSNNDTEFNIMQQDISAEAVNVVGTLTENNNVWSGFSNNNYLTLPQNLSLSATDEWEIQFKFLQNSINTNNRYIMLSDKLYIYVFNGYVYVYYPLTGVNPQYASSAMDTQVHYRWIKVKREIGSGTFTTVCSISTDGTNWTTFKNLSTTGTPYAFTSGVKLGAASTAQQALNGSIDLNECYIKINGTTWWSGQGQTAKSVAKATTSLYGLVKPDGTSITVNDGVISGFSGNYNDLSNKPTIGTCYWGE